MKLFKKKKIKKIVLENIAKGRNIFSEAEKCFGAANSIYWCHTEDLYVHDSLSDDLELVQRLRREFPKIIPHLEELMLLYNANLKLCLDCPDLEASSSYFFIKCFESLNNKTSDLIISFKNLEEYKSHNHLQDAVSILEEVAPKIEKYFNEITNINEIENAI